MKFKENETWLSISHRVLQYHQAAEVDPIHPYHVEPRYYFRVIRSDSVLRLAQRTTGVVAGKYADTVSSPLETLRSKSQHLNTMPVSTADLLGFNMVHR